MAELVKALGETKAVIVGHDWGAPVAWHAALWRPDLFTAVCGMSVPYRAAGPCRPPDGAGEARHHRLLHPVLPEARRRRSRAAAGHQGRAPAALLHRQRRPRARQEGLRPAAERHAARQHRRSGGAARVAERSRPRLLHGRVRAHRLSRRAELVSQHSAQLGARRALARPADPRAVAVHRRQQGRRAALPGRGSRSSMPFRRPCPACAAATSSTAPATGSSRSGPTR